MNFLRQGDTKYIQRRLFISGRVQGVGFRINTREAAASRGEAEPGGTLRGFVRNLSDGRVEAVFCGPPAAVKWMVAWCQHGPPHADVAQVKVYKEDPDADLEPFARLFTRENVWPVLRF